MKIFITKLENHITYGRMSEKPMLAFRDMNHTVECGKPRGFSQDFTIILGTSAHWEDVKNLPGKKILWCHGVSWYRGFEHEENTFLKEVFDNCDAVAYQSKFAKHMAEKAFGLKDGPIILNADKPRFTAYPPQLHTATINVATTAIWRLWKRLEQTEEIVDWYNKSYGAPKIHLYVYGKDPKDKTVGNPDFIHYLGMSQDFSMYDKCHFYTQLSFNDYSPATVGEAMAYGLPVICTNSGGSKDIVGDAGIVVDADPFVDYPLNIYSDKELPKLNKELMIKAFQEMIRNLPAFRVKVRDRVLSVANSKYSAQQFLNLYSGL